VSGVHNNKIEQKLEGHIFWEGLNAGDKELLV
jgi:hypothetical protein